MKSYVWARIFYQILSVTIVIIIGEIFQDVNASLITIAQLLFNTLP